MQGAGRAGAARGRRLGARVHQAVQRGRPDEHRRARAGGRAAAGRCRPARTSRSTRGRSRSAAQACCASARVTCAPAPPAAPRVDVRRQHPGGLLLVGGQQREHARTLAAGRRAAGPLQPGRGRLEHGARAGPAAHRGVPLPQLGVARAAQLRGAASRRAPAAGAGPAAAGACAVANGPKPASERAPAPPPRRRGTRRVAQPLRVPAVEHPLGQARAATARGSPSPPARARAPAPATGTGRRRRARADHAPASERYDVRVRGQRADEVLEDGRRAQRPARPGRPHPAQRGHRGRRPCHSGSRSSSSASTRRSRAGVRARVPRQRTVGVRLDHGGVRQAQVQAHARPRRSGASPRRRARAPCARAPSRVARRRPERAVLRAVRRDVADRPAGVEQRRRLGAHVRPRRTAQADLRGRRSPP